MNFLKVCWISRPVVVDVLMSKLADDISTVIKAEAEDIIL